MNVTKLLQFYEQRRESGEPLVLVTVFETEGSTYSKAGAQMLVDRNGVFRGMLSGGCLEGDLAVRAGQVLDSGKPQVATYDLGQDDELWGMGAGCDGLMRMVLQPLSVVSRISRSTAGHCSPSPAQAYPRVRGLTGRPLWNCCCNWQMPISGRGS